MPRRERATMADLRERLAAQAEEAARAARGPGVAATLRRARARRRRLLGGRVALSLLLVAGLAGLTSRLLDEREPASPPQPTAPLPRQIAPLWTARGAASEPLAPQDRTLRAVGDLVVATTGFGGPSGRTRAYDARTGAFRWLHRTGPNAFITAVGGGMVVVAPQYGPLVGLELATGRERWRFPLAEGQGPESGTVAGDTLYVGTSFPAEGNDDPPVVYALDVATGRQRWRTVLDPGTDLQWAGPVVDGGQVLVADTLSHEGSAPASHLHALDAATGRRRWRADLHAPTQGFFNDHPVLAGGLVYLPTASGTLLAVDARSGREVWRDDSGFPVLAGVRDGLVIALVDGRLVGFDAATGARRWQTGVGTGAGEQWAVLDGDTVLAAAGGALVAVDAASGAARWRAPVGPAVGQPVVAGDRVYVATRDRLVAVDRGSRSELWASSRLRPVTAPVVTAGRVVVATRDGTLLGFAP
jgi:outer membrane protein assembly factor BamB